MDGLPASCIIPEIFLGSGTPLKNIEEGLWKLRIPLLSEKLENLVNLAMNVNAPTLRLIGLKEKFAIN